MQPEGIYKKPIRKQNIKSLQILPIKVSLLEKVYIYNSTKQTTLHMHTFLMLHSHYAQMQKMDVHDFLLLLIIIQVSVLISTKPQRLKIGYATLLLSTTKKLNIKSFTPKLSPPCITRHQSQQQKQQRFLGALTLRLVRMNGN